MTLTVRFSKDEDGWWVATVDGVAGCHTQGKSIEQARERIREALALSGIESAQFTEVIENDTL